MFLSLFDHCDLTYFYGMNVIGQVAIDAIHYMWNIYVC